MSAAIEQVRLGVLGVGKLGSVHARSVDTLPDARLVAVCDSSRDALKRAAQHHDVLSTTDIDEFLSMDLDGVVIASSTPLHCEHIRAVARAGKAIFTEKPVGLTLPETDDVLQEVVDAGLVFQINFQRRWDATYLQVKDIIASGEIGEPVLFKAHGRDPDASNPANWGLDRNGGLFLNCAIHDFDAARFLLGREVGAVAATGASLVHKGLGAVGDIDTCSVSLFFGDDLMAITEWSRYASHGYDIGLEVVGTEGYVRMGSHHDSPVVVRRRNDTSSSVFDVFGDAYRNSIAAFAAAIRTGNPASPGVEDARSALHLALCARESYAAGARVEVPTLLPLTPRVGTRPASVSAVRAPAV